jgi:excisionase family DNA binding protein
VTEPLREARYIADLLGVKESWVREHTRSGEVPHVRLGRYVRYREGDVLAWVASLATPGKPGAAATIRPIQAPATRERPGA